MTPRTTGGLVSVLATTLKIAQLKTDRLSNTLKDLSAMVTLERM